MLKHGDKANNFSANKNYKIFIHAPLSNQPEGTFVRPEDQIKVTLINIQEKKQSIASIQPEEHENL
jgi:hypothetical protein